MRRRSRAHEQAASRQTVDKLSVGAIVCSQIEAASASRSAQSSQIESARTPRRAQSTQIDPVRAPRNAQSSQIEPVRAPRRAQGTPIEAASTPRSAQGSQIEAARASRSAQSNQIEATRATSTKHCPCAVKSTFRCTGPRFLSSQIEPAMRPGAHRAAKSSQPGRPGARRAAKSSQPGRAEANRGSQSAPGAIRCTGPCFSSCAGLFGWTSSLSSLSLVEQFRY